MLKVYHIFVMPMCSRKGRVSMPSIKQLQYFAALAEEKNMSRLASKLYVSQTALSNSIARLEEELGVSLFERTPNGLAVNECGKLYLTYAKKILGLIAEAGDAVKDKYSDKMQTLSVALNSPVLYSGLLGSFMAKYPNYIIRQSQCDANIIKRLEDKRDIDVILAGYDDFSSPYLENRVVITDKIYLCVPPEHKFAGRESISLEECQSVPFIFKLEETGFSKFSMKLFANAGYNPRVVAWCDYNMRKQLFEQRAGVVLASDAVRRVNYFGDCVYIPLEPTTTREMALFWRKGEVLAPPVRAFIDYSTGYFAEQSKLDHTSS